MSATKKTLSKGSLSKRGIIFMEKKKNSAYIIPICATAAALVSVVIRLLLSMSSLDVSYGVYKRGTVLPTVYHILLALICAAFIIPPVISKLLKKDASATLVDPKKGDLTIFTSCVSAFLIAAVLLTKLYDVLVGHQSIDKYGVFTIVFGIPSIIFFLALLKNGVGHTPLLAFLSLFPTAFMATDLINVYFDKTLLITSPGRTIHELALLSGMLYFLNESRFLLEKPSAPLFYAFAPVASVMMLSASVPELILPGTLLIGDSDSYILRAAEAAIALFILARLWSAAKTPVTADTAQEITEKKEAPVSESTEK